LIASTYTLLTAAELWRERRKSVLHRWPAMLVPVLHAAVFLAPIALAGVVPVDGRPSGVAKAASHCDRALYRAKAKGRNRIEAAEEVMPAAPPAEEETQPAERFWHALPGQMRLRVIASRS
jgi:hypothetical protein